MNNIKIVALIIMGALVFSAPALYAYSPDRGGQHGKDFESRIDKREKEIFRDLNLTAEQKKALEDNKNKNRIEMKASFEAKRAKERQLREELQKVDMDIKKVNEINNELKSLHAKMADQRLAGILEVRKILTPEQFKKFNEKMEKRIMWEHKNKEK